MLEPNGSQVPEHSSAPAFLWGRGASLAVVRRGAGDGWPATNVRRPSSWQPVPFRYFLAAFLRSTADSSRLRRRTDCGVTSTSSSSSMYSRASSSVKVTGGVS